jgi:predicted phage terminase large subunit-like protein
MNNILDLIKYKQEQLLEIKKVIEARINLYEFFKQAWEIVEGPTVPFVENWHIKAMCEHLEACYRREIKNLVINVPPRSGKTNLISIVFPVWVWLQNPAEKFAYASYALNLALEHSLKCRRLVTSDWFQERWGKLFRLTDDQNAKSFFTNDKSGSRLCMSVGSKNTGKGANIFVFDDPNNARDGDSTLRLENVNNWYDQEIFNRVNDPKRDVRILVQQRIHESDLTGHILKNDKAGDWVKLIIPMEYMETRKCKTLIGNKEWQDPRTKTGELMFPDRFGEREVHNYKTTLGSLGYASQYQQMPVPAEGGIIKRHWFLPIKDTNILKYSLILQSWDTAISDKQDAAFSACTTWGVVESYDEGVLPKIVLLSTWKGRVGYPDLRERARRLFLNYQDVGEEPIKNIRKQADVCLIEAKATGDPLVRDLKKIGIPAVGFYPKGDKEYRVHRITPYLESGFVFLPTIEGDEKKLRPYAESFLNDVSMFPKGDSRDLTDSMTQAIAWLRDRREIKHPREETIESKCINFLKKH